MSLDTELLNFFQTASSASRVTRRMESSPLFNGWSQYRDYLYFWDADPNRHQLAVIGFHRAEGRPYIVELALSGLLASSGLSPVGNDLQQLHRDGLLIIPPSEGGRALSVVTELYGLLAHLTGIMPASVYDSRR